MNSLLVTMPQCQPCRVHFNEENILVWPVLFTYPEYNTTDFVQEFSENTKFVIFETKFFFCRKQFDIFQFL